MILVTGGTGLLGSHLLLELVKSNKQVRALKRPSSDINKVLSVFQYYTPDAEMLFKRITWEDADLLDVVELETHFDGIDVVYHCAAIVSFHPKKTREMLRFNPISTANLVNIALHLGVKKFGYVSSVASLGRTKESKVLDEDNIWIPSPENSRYAQSKYYAEMEVWRGIEEGLPAVIINPSIILGPGFWESGSGHIFPTVYNGFPYITAGVNAFVDVRDVATILIQLVEKRVFGKRFVVAAENQSFKFVFQAIAENFGKPLPTKVPPSWLMEVLWRLEFLRSKFTGSYPLVTKETARTSQGVFIYSSDRVKKELNFTFKALDTTLSDFCSLFEKDLKN